MLQLPSSLIELQELVSIAFFHLMMMMMIQVGWFLFLSAGVVAGPLREGLGRSAAGSPDCDLRQAARRRCSCSCPKLAAATEMLSLIHI